MKAHATHLRVEGILRQLAFEQLVLREAGAAPPAKSPSATPRQGDSTAKSSGTERALSSMRAEAGEELQGTQRSFFKSGTSWASRSTTKHSGMSGTFSRSFYAAQGVTRNPELLHLLKEVRRRKVPLQLPADDELRFTPVQVLEALHRADQQDSFFVQVANGELAWQYVARLFARRAVVLVVCFLLVFFLLALFLFAVPADVQVEGSQTGQVLSDPASEASILPSEYGGGVTGGLAGTAMAASLQPLWALPSLGQSELRALADIVFVHNSLTQVMRVAAVGRSPEGNVIVRTTEGSVIRVEASGDAFWRPLGLPEIALQQVNEMRSELSGLKSWLTSSMSHTFTVTN